MAHIFQSTDFGAELEAEKEREAAKKQQKEAAKEAKKAAALAAQADSPTPDADIEAGISTLDVDDHDPNLDKLSIMTAASTRCAFLSHKLA